MTQVEDGQQVPASTPLAEFSGAARTILTGERTMLNLPGHLSGIATGTRAIGDAVARVRAAVGHTVTVEVEVDCLDQLDEALAAGVDVVLLDNMSPDELRAAVTEARGRAILEASGGITLESARSMAETGVDVISVGWITHSVPRLDVALDL